MKQVLIIAEGKVAKIFLEFLLEKYHSNNTYTIISNDSEILAISDKLNVVAVEPTSAFFLTPFITQNLYSIFVIFQNHAKSNEICHIIRSVSSEIPIIVLMEQKSFLDKKLQDDFNINIVSSNFLSAKSLIEKVPNIPIIARGFGLNKGEIMQINIPFGSAYSHISVGSILQKGWSIAGIYRKNSLIQVKDSTTILPNDSILAVGEPRILNKIYKRINHNKHSFPAPFGRDICVYIDFKMSKKAEILNILNDALWLHKKIKNDNLIITALNPSDINTLKYLKSLNSEDILIRIDYTTTDIMQKIALDSAKKMGLIIVPCGIFSNAKNRRTLYKANRPILKVGTEVRLSEIGDSLTLATDSAYMQNIAYNIVDISSQLDLNIMLYEFEIDGEYNENLATYYRNLCKIFRKETHTHRTKSNNPIFWLYRQKILQFIPLEVSIMKSKFSWILEKNSHYLSLNIHKNPQILLPI